MQAARPLIASLTALAVLLTSLATAPIKVRADDRRNSSELAYGAFLDARGLYVAQAVEIAARLDLDWISLEFDWSMIWPDPAGEPDFRAVGHAAAAAQSWGRSVIIAITNPPGWALSANGPDPLVTTDLVIRLGRQISNLRAVELFPGANTLLGWGRAPDPHAYLELFSRVQQAVQASGSGLILIAGGLTALAADHTPPDLDDLQFLEALYQLGAANIVSRLGLQLTEVTGDPMASPFQSEARVLRHYELVRSMMLKYHHSIGQIWITRISWPSGKINADDRQFQNPAQQSRWLHQALSLLGAQLYIEAVIFDRLNPASGSDADLAVSNTLIFRDSSLHPALRNLGQLTSSDGNPLSTVWDLKTAKKLFSPKILFKPGKR